MTLPQEVPSIMKRLVVTSPEKEVVDCKMEVQKLPVPKPGVGEVLIKVVAAAINPSDQADWTTLKPEECPAPMGREGCGIVVAVGDLFTSFICPVGTPVGFIALDEGQGSYSEYIVASATEATFAMPKELAIEDAASFFVNPYTAIGIFDTARREGANVIVHTAAASQLGQMMVKLAPSEGMEIINVVRRQEQADLLKELGAKYVVVTGGGNSDSWKAALKSKMLDLGCNCAFDAVGGTMPGDLLEMIPDGGTVFSYGALAGNLGNIDPIDLIYRQKNLKGFYLTSWVMNGGVLKTLMRLFSAGRKVNSGLLEQNGWCKTQFVDTTLETAVEDSVKSLAGKATGQKLRILFN